MLTQKLSFVRYYIPIKMKIPFAFTLSFQSIGKRI